MYFLEKYWVLLCLGCFGLLVLAFCLVETPKQEVAPDYTALAEIGRAPASAPVVMKPAPKPAPESVARGAARLQGQEPEFFKDLNPAEREELLAQVDEVARIEQESQQLQESEILDESAFGIVNAE